MIIDLIFAALLVFAAIKGYQKGLIVAVFSFIAIIVGLAAAMKLSTIAAGYISSAVNISAQWLPVVSFIIVFIAVILLIRLGATAIEKTVQLALLGWVNRLGGIIFFAAIYLTIFSVLLFYAVQMELLKPETLKQSVTYAFVQPWGPKAISAIGWVLPFFRNMFTELEVFFDQIAKSQTT
jgi:membrane protein required for colicin V production